MQLTPIRRLPKLVGPTPAPPIGPDGTQPAFVVTADQATLSLGPSMRNRSIDLAGHSIGEVIFEDGFSHARVTNGIVGTFRSRALAALTPERAHSVSDLVIDNLFLTGRSPWREGNQLRGERILLSDLKSVAASVRGALDGFENYAMWIDYGSRDIVLQDSNLWTRGGQACFRAMACKRVLVIGCALGSSTESYAARFHGPSSSQLGAARDQTPCEDCGIYGTMLRGRGLMVGAEPDGTERYADVVRRFTASNVMIDMLGDGSAGQDASLMLPPATLSPEGLIRLEGLAMIDVTIRTPRPYNPLVNEMAIARSHPEYHWTFSNVNYVHV